MPVFRIEILREAINDVKTNVIKADPKFKQISFTTDQDLWSFREFPNEDQEIGVRLEFESKKLPKLTPFIYSD
jgi:hypothetical protein